MILFSYKFVFATTINFRYQENGGNPSCTFIIDGYTFFVTDYNIRYTNLKNGLGDFILFKREGEMQNLTFTQYNIILVDENLSTSFDSGGLRLSGSPYVRLLKYSDGNDNSSVWLNCHGSGIYYPESSVISTNLEVGELMGYVPNYRDWQVQYLGEAMTPLLENLFIRMRAQVVEIVRTIAFLALLLVLSITLLRKFLLFLKNFGSSL